ncbi:lactate dehydrogenase, partial [Staphylococcus pseudintermedius]
LIPELRILPVANLYTTSTGLTVYISLPSIVSEEGVEQMLHESLNAEEDAQLNASCAVLHAYIQQLTLY